MSRPRPAVHSVVRAATVFVAAAVTAGFVPPAAAHADGTYRWQNVLTGQYLEVYKKSKANGGIVNVWPLNGGRNQLWKNTKTSGGYNRVRNVNSGRSLDRWNQNFSGGAKCPLTQWSWWGGNQQHWKAISVWSRVGRRFTLWYNRAGCMGNPWHDTIGVLKPFRYSNAILYTRSWCDESTYSGWNANHCFWKRNGK
ncbi:RICIN domain-containing protein [Nonomuraea fuscirosea]|jgi:hypothetical protein|uniref:RICIN domain-containing protein n=1 Tax=Nonomuraea fuscirosea TaxID=1291556 RepID=UPI0037AF87EA